MILTMKMRIIAMETNLSCPNCGAFHVVYKEKDYKEKWTEGYKE